MTVVILAEEHDVHADAVVAKIPEEARVIRVDPLSEMVDIYFNSMGTKIRLDGVDFEINEVTGVFCRFALEASNQRFLDDPVERYSRSEYIGSLLQILSLVNHRLWINHPCSEILSEGKVFPLRLAASLGINVPEFVITNDKSDALKFSSLKNSIIKPITDASIAFQDGVFKELPDLAPFESTYTTIFRPEVMLRASVDKTPFLLQELLETSIEVRVSAIDCVFFATSVQRAGGPIDVRQSVRPKYAYHEIPEALKDLLARLMDRLSIRFATFDFLVKTSDEYWLLDINPSGNWLWQEIEFDRIEVSNEIAKALLSTSIGEKKCC